MKGVSQRSYLNTSPSIGKFGGIRALPCLRLLLNNLGLTVSHHDIAIPFADKNFNQKGEKKPLYSGVDMNKALQFINSYFNFFTS